MNRFVRLGSTFVLAIFAATVVGCSSSTEATVTVEVNYDGTPLKDGAIRFVPTDGKTATSGGVIANGKFTGPVPIGEMRVEITAPKVVGKKKAYETPESPMVDVIEELLDEKYNAKSELKMTVKSGSQTEKFDLKPKTKK